NVAATTVTAARSSDQQAAPDRFRLHVVFPPELRRAFPLGDRETVAGRDPGLDGLVLEHGTISRRHAALAWDGARRVHALRDLGSRNGSSVDGVAAAADEARSLVDGSILRLGDVLLVYEQDAGGAGDGEDGVQVARDAVPGQAARVRRLRALLGAMARDPAPVLIIGETGTGKERIARELHRLSGRGGKLVALNCAALSAQIVESQLFGHVKGAFTGATEAQPGLFRAAHGGTIFLDEIGDLPPELQPKLLRVLQEGEVLPVGATQPARVDVRVVAATHRDLGRGVAEGKFREDLYARLSIAELHVPALRERRIDLLDWVARLHADWAAKRGGDGSAPRFDADAAEALLRFGWPLNLRGVERLVHELGAGAGGGGVIGKAALPSWLGTRAAGVAALASPAAGDTAAAAGGAAEGAGREPVPTRDEFTRAFEELGGSVHGLAKRFGRDRRQIYRWIETHGLGDRRPRGR
ncbi:MAG TPA: sigma-54-dependent Fis family transcriptional regulator, partial [Candidatus Polarisedimenticolia bacterium]|nr:sigma-54-dependent Fis family transcriptional regulator [Candidatus Polarisedimenticolia bacterium]